MFGKPIFFTSDWHIGHVKAIEYDKRPFRDIHHMHETLILRFNSTVPENGVTYFIGDMGNKPEEIAAVVKRLNGIKVLFLGNHDKGMGTMYNCGFDVVLWGGILYLGDIRITLSHCPLIGVWREDTNMMGKRKHWTDAERKAIPPDNWHGEKSEKHLRFATKDEGQLHLHGHIHSNDEWKSSKTILGKQFDVGVCAHGYAPVSMKTVASWAMKTMNKEIKDEG